MSARILIIEDNAANLELMTYLLRAFGYAVEAASNGAEGIAQASAASPDLIVCDIQMPVLDGYEVARRLKADLELRHVPLVAVTALAMVGDRERMLAAGFDGYVAKPIEPEQFVPEIERFLSAQSAPLPAAPAPESSSPAARPDGPLILVVDNLPVNRELARSILEPFGYRVLTAGGVHEGLAALPTADCALVLSDICMADGDGYTLLQAVRANPLFQQLPFIFLTSTATNETARARGLALGANRFLFRPIDPEMLLAEVRSCLEKSQDKRSGHSFNH